MKYLLICLTLLLASCNLTQEVEIELPEYDRQPVVECYLEPGQPIRLLLTRSYAFFDPFGLDSNFLENTLLDGALVTVSYDGKTDTLINGLTFVFNPVKLYNYSSPSRVPVTPGMQFYLNILLPDGNTVTGQTTMLPHVPIDSVLLEWSPNNDTLARVLTYITDDPGAENYYRRMLNYASLDSVPEQDFLVNDRLNTTNLIAFGTGYEAGEGDTVINTIFHITKPHYDYIESVQLAIFGNVNPFAQPSPIKSNVSGTGNPLGIFTCLVYDRDTTIVMR
jgi:hypothetical protein